MPQSIARKNFDKWMIPVYAPAPFIPARGEGSHLWDRQRKEYIDFAGGTVVNALGRAHPRLHGTLNEQVSKFWYTGSGYTNGPVLRLAKGLIDTTSADRVFFRNSGAKANEAALKLVREFAYDRYGSHKNDIMAFKSALHGRTLFAINTGGQSVCSQDFAPLPPDIRHAVYNDINSASVPTDDATCAVIIEPIQEESGVVPVSSAFLQGLCELCDHHSTLLIFNEAQTGAGCTGELYACMHYGVTSGLLITAKALDGGFPVGALLATEECASMMAVGTHGTTYGGNPLASAVVGKVLDLIDAPEIFNGAKQRRDWLVECLNSVNRHYSLFSEVRGLDLLIGCVLNIDYVGQARQVFQEAVKADVTVLVAGDNVVCFAPALNVSEEEVATGLDRFMATCEHFVSRSSS